MSRFGRAWADVVALEVSGAQMFIAREKLGLGGGCRCCQSVLLKKKMHLPVVGVNILRLGLAAVAITIG